ncbi:hypothetical protein ACNKHV_08795 [Shigella flexneri]
MALTRRILKLFRVNQIIARVSQSLTKEQSLKVWSESSGDAEMVTDMESTYLTKVDVKARLQHIMFARNSQKIHVPRIYPSRGITRYANAPLIKTAFSAMKSLTVAATVLRHAILASPHF